MSDVTLRQVREHVESDLSDSALTRLLSAAAQEIASVAGAHNAQRDTFLLPDSRVLVTSRPVVSVTSITERVGGVGQALAASDWRLTHSRELLRLATGANPRVWWGEEVVVVYVPVSDLDIRRRVQIDLVKLSIQYSGAKSEKAGDYSVTLPEYQAERDMLLAPLLAGRLGLV